MSHSCQIKQTFDAAKERREQDGTEYKFGAVLGQCLFAIPYGERSKFLPTPETQHSYFMDTMDCASRSVVNMIETKLNYALKTGKISIGNAAWLDENGYIDDNGSVSISDAYVAILSGTTKQGNSLKAPLQTVRHDGCIPKKLMPLLPDMTWDNYYNPNRITTKLNNLGREFAKRFTINYEQVSRSQFKEAIKKGMLDVAVYAWPSPVDGVYPRVQYGYNHAIMVADAEFDIFDNYDPFIKHLAPDYDFFDWGYHVIISADTPDPKEEAAWSALLAQLRQLIALLQTRLGAWLGFSR